MTRGSRNETTLQILLLGVHQVEHHGSGIVIHAGNPGFVFDDIEFTSIVGGFNDLAVDFIARAEQNFGFAAFDCPTNAAELVGKFESVATGASIGTVHVGTQL